MAIYQSIKYFRHMLEGRPFVIRTDHKPLTFAFVQRADKASPRQLRQLDFIGQFSTKIIHIAGSDNLVANALSRIEEIAMPVVFDTDEIAKAQQEDSELKQLLQSDSSIKLQKFVLNDALTVLYCDTSLEDIRPYIPSV